MGGQGAWIMPFLDFAVPIGEGQTAGAVMVIGRKVTPNALSIHPHQEIAIVNALGMFIEENKCLGWRGTKDLRVLDICKFPARCCTAKAFPPVV